MRILVADDDDVARELLANVLGKCGFDVCCVSGGTEAIETLGATPFPVVICDWEMPDTNGLDVCRWVRSSGAHKGTCIILLTAKVGLGDIVEGLDNGADTFLSKPCDPWLLLDHVRVGQHARACLANEASPSRAGADVVASGLSLEHVQRSLLGMEDGYTGNDEQRSVARMGVRARLSVYTWANGALGPRIEAWSRDISNDSIGFICRDTINKGKVVAIQLTRAEQPPLTLLYRVKRRDDLRDGVAFLGARLVGGISVELALALQSTASRAPAGKLPAVTAAPKAVTPRDDRPAPVPPAAPSAEPQGQISRIKDAILGKSA